MAKYCIANIFVLLGLAWLRAWPGLALSLSPSACPPLSLSLSSLDLFNFLFLLLLSYALLCFAAFASRKVAKLT